MRTVRYVGTLFLGSRDMRLVIAVLLLLLLHICILSFFQKYDHCSRPACTTYSENLLWRPFDVLHACLRPA